MWELKYDFQDPVGVVRIMEDWSGEGNGIGGLQWPGGVVLCRYMDSREVFPEAHFVGCRMIEVGAGCGLTSIYGALRGANVTITDMDIGKCVDNVESNLAPRGMEANACVRRLEWGSAAEMARFEPPYDVVIAGDCLYEEACIVPLLQTMWTLAGPSTEVLLCGVAGHGVLDSFLSQVDLYFDRETVDTAMIDTFAEVASVETLGGNATAAAALISNASTVAASATAPSAAPHAGEGVGETTSTSDAADAQSAAGKGGGDAANGEEETSTSYSGGLAGGQRPGLRALLRLRKKCDAVFVGGGRVEVVAEELGATAGGAAGVATAVSAAIAAVVTC